MPFLSNRSNQRFNRQTKSIRFNLPTNFVRQNVAILLLIAFLSMIPINSARGATVTYNLAPDTGFGAGGRTVIDLGSRYEEGRAMVIQPDGKVLIVGKTHSIDGPLVRASGGGRISVTCMEEEPEVPSRIDFVLARFNTDGSLDTSFGSGGKVLTDLGAEDEAKAVAVQPDGKIVVAGVTYVSFYAFSHGVPPFNHIALARYNADGSLDSSFGSGGKVVTSYAPDNGRPSAVAVSGGKIIITRPNFSLSRFNSDGSLDTTFGVGGTAAPQFSDGDSVSALVVQPDKKIVAVGSALINSQSVFAVARFNNDGSLDNTFGQGGVSLTAFSSNSSGATSVVLQPDGKVVVGGSLFRPATFNGFWDFAVARYNAEGSLDAGFGSGGVTTAPVSETSCGDNCGASAISVQPNGKIIAVGRRFVARFNRSGTPDLDFGNLGVIVLGAFDQFTGVLAQSDNRIILAGGVTSPIPDVLFTSESCGNGNLLLARYKVVVEVFDDEDTIGDDGIPIEAPDVVRLYAPLVFLHSEEKYKPADASIFVMNSDLRWSHQGEFGQLSSCESHPVAGRGTIVERRLGDPALQTGELGAALLPPYLHQVRSFSSCPHSARTMTTREQTRPFDKRHNYLATFGYAPEGFYLAPLKSDLFRQGAFNTSLQPDNEYAGAPVYYEYVPRQYITYWFFYAYNKFEAKIPVIGLPSPIDQAHEGDWEQVSIHLDCDNKPIEIAYYKHGGPDPYPWPSAGGSNLASDSVALAGTHPIVFSARGSHASYPNTGSHPGLDFLQEDQTNAGMAWKTWRALKPLKKQGWYGYGGAWGEVRGQEYLTGPLGPSRYKAAYPSYWSSPLNCGNQ